MKTAKSLSLFLVTLLCSTLAFGQIQVRPVPCAPDGPCIYIVPPTTSPAVQIDASSSLGIGLLSQTKNGTAIWSGATGNGTAIWAAAIGEAVALRVQGRMVKQYEPRHLLKLYDVDTGKLLYTFAYSFE